MERTYTLFTYERNSSLLKNQNILSTLGVAVDVLLDINGEYAIARISMSAIDIKLIGAERIGMVISNLPSPIQAAFRNDKLLVLLNRRTNSYIERLEHLFTE